MIRVHYLKKEANVADDYQCTLEEEMKVPSFRKSVQKLIEEGRVERAVYDVGEKNALQIK